MEHGRETEGDENEEEQFPTITCEFHGFGVLDSLKAGVSAS